MKIVKHLDELVEICHSSSHWRSAANNNSKHISAAILMCPVTLDR